MSQNPQQIHLDLSQARRTGATFFAISGSLQGIAFLLFIFVLSTYRFYRDAEWLHGGWTWKGWLNELKDDGEAFTAAFFAMLLLVMVSWAFGRWAGRLIGIEKRGFGWVSPLLTLGTSMLASFAFVLILAYMDRYMREDLQEDFPFGFALPWVVFTGIYFVGGIVPSLLAGLVVRQRLRGLEEKAHLQAKESEMAHLQAMEADSTPQ